MEHFILNVKKYPCLWATSIEEYKMNELKDAAWRNVIKECDLPNIKEAKNLWKKLRDGHRQSLNKKKPITGQPSDNDRNWKYEKTMEFLLPYMVNRQKITNTVTTTDHLRFQQSQNITTDYRADINSETDFEADENRTKKKRPNKEKQTRDKKGADSDSLRRYLLTQQENNTAQKDAMKSFFDTMYKMSKCLPEHIQMKIQREVFNTVMQAREEISSSLYNITDSIPMICTATTDSRAGSSQSVHSPESPHTIYIQVNSPPSNNITNVNCYSDDDATY